MNSFFPFPIELFFFFNSLPLIFFFFFFYNQEYLNDEEFASLIGVSRADFAAQPKWRRDNKKKELGLF